MRSRQAASQGRERQPSVAARSIWMTLYFVTPWSRHKDEQVLQEASGGKDVDLKLIPPKTTKYAQSLDVCFFRKYKIYEKRIADFIKLRSSNMQPKYTSVKFQHLSCNYCALLSYQPMCCTSELDKS